MAAHEIVSVTDEWFKKITNKSANEIMKGIKSLCRYAGIKADKEAWDSYLHMNEMIVKNL